MAGYKRLSFEKIGGDDSSRLERTRKGVLREFTAPRWSVPFSTEGTGLWDRVDENTIFASVKNRNELARTLQVFDCLQYDGSELFNAEDAIEQKMNTTFLPDARLTPPGVYR